MFRLFYAATLAVTNDDAWRKVEKNCAVARSQRLSGGLTIGEQGLKGSAVVSWTGVLVPARTPEEIVRRLYTDIAKIVQTD